MDIERTLETQRHRLLRIVAGLVLLLGVLAIGPVSRRFSDWTLGFVGSVLSRIEIAVRYMVTTQACLMVDHCGLGVHRRQISVAVAPELGFDEATVSLTDCRQRLRAVRDVLMNLPRHALRLLRRIARQTFGAIGPLPRPTPCCSAPLRGWTLPASRIERPPDKGLLRIADFFTSPGTPAGGAGG